MGDPLKTPTSRGGNWDDLRIPVTVTKTGGSKKPGFVKIGDNGAGSQGVFTYAFDFNTEEELYFVAQMPHSWKLGTDLDIHVHWGGSDASVANVVWGLEYSAATIGGNLGTTTIITTTGTTSGVASDNQYTDFTPVITTGWELSQLILCRIFRDATNAADTYNADAYLYEIDFHYKQDSIGSQEEFLK